MAKGLKKHKQSGQSFKKAQTNGQRFKKAHTNDQMFKKPNLETADTVKLLKLGNRGFPKRQPPNEIDKITGYPNETDPNLYVEAFNPETGSVWFKHPIKKHGSHFTLTQIPGKNLVFTEFLSELDPYPAYLCTLDGTKKYHPKLRISK